MKLKAISVQQGLKKFWLSNVLLRDIIGKVRIDRHSPENPQGYQREVSISRAKKFGKFMQRGGFSPITLLINIRDGELIEHENEIEIPDSVDLWIIDGQHRFEGLKIVAEEDPLLREIQLPVVIMKVDRIEEAKNFLIINKFQKGVRTDLAERIFSTILEREGTEAAVLQNLPLEYWRHEALQIVDFLTTNPDSPLYNLIKRPGEKGSKPLKQVSVVDSLEPVVNNYKGHLRSTEHVAKALINMWSALNEILPECFSKPSQYLLLKTTGIFVMHRLFANLLPNLSMVKDLTKGMFYKIFTHRDISKFFESDWWDRENRDGVGIYGTSQKSFKLITDIIWEKMSFALEEIISIKDIDIKL